MTKQYIAVWPDGSMSDPMPMKQAQQLKREDSDVTLEVYSDTPDRNYTYRVTETDFRFGE